MINQNSVMATLSPTTPLEIELNVPAAPETCVYKEKISNSKYREFQRRSIANTFRDLIFHDKDELQSWMQKPEFRKRARLFEDTVRRDEATDEAANRVLTMLLGFGRIDSAGQQTIRRQLHASERDDILAVRQYGRR
jgi:hypothetical protein